MRESGKIGPNFSDGWEDHYTTTANFAWRKQIYKYASPERGGEPFADIYDATIKYLNFSGEESILDVGFGDNQFLINLRQKHGHTGVLYGIDNEDIIRQAKLKDRNKYNINLYPGEAENLNFEDNSLDLVTAFFMLYHTDRDKALTEMHRVIKPGGKLVAATSSWLNKRRQREFEKLIAEELGIQPPPLFNKSFNSFNALELLERNFKKPETVIVQFGHIPIDNNNLHEYLDSIISMQQTFSPYPKIKDFKRVINDKVVPVIQERIDENGAFYETVHRTVHVCGKL